ncbi:MAG: lysophospholipid acyltransferase family protein [Nitrospiria bacterium]
MSFSSKIQKRLLSFSACLFIRVLIKIWQWTCRIEVKGPLLETLKGDKPLILTCWHQDMIFNFAYILKINPRRKIATIVSHSEDGDLAASVIQNLGAIVVRGSSSRGGREALGGLTRIVLKEKAIGMIVCDGPKPPGRIVKPGILLLARKSSYPIMQIRSWSNRGFLFKKSWSKLHVVFPFSRVILWSAPPITIPTDTKKPEMLRFRRQIEEGLNKMADHSENYFKKYE